MSGFGSLRQSGKIYVDKTLSIYRLASNKGGKYLLARPRRFGKSLLISTFDSLFKHELRDFQGLAIEKQWNNKTCDAVRLDFSGIGFFSSQADFLRRLIEMLADAFAPFCFSYCPDSIIQFEVQVSRWLEERPTSSLVILIDEYDAPLTACLDNRDCLVDKRRH